jgi:hypothetical protein
MDHSTRQGDNQKEKRKKERKMREAESRISLVKREAYLIARKGLRRERKGGYQVIR